MLLKALGCLVLVCAVLVFVFSGFNLIYLIDGILPFAVLFSAGVIVDNTDAQRDALRDILEQLTAIRDAVAPKPASSIAEPISADPVKAPSAPVQSAAPVSDDGPVTPDLLPDGEERCPACGAVQLAGRSACYRCERRFERQADSQFDSMGE